MRCRALVTLTAATAIVFAVAPAFAQVKGTATYWKLTYLGDQPIPVVRWAHEPHVILHPDTRRASGAGGCNRFTGSYEVNGDRLAFGETAATMMACLEGMETEKAFFAADSRLVTVEGGIVGGAAAGGGISWKGIPYAAPPVGNLRWRLPQIASPSMSGALPRPRRGLFRSWCGCTAARWCTEAPPSTGLTPWRRRAS